MLRRALRWSVAFAAIFAVGCGGSIPTHGGYKSRKSKPWRKAKPIELDENFEGEAEDTINYPKWRRSRWYFVDTPSFGELEVQLTTSSLVDDLEHEVDIAFEVLDENNQVLVRADAEEEDSGEEIKERTLYELDAGRYMIHAYAQERIDIAEISIRVTFKSERKDHKSDFPAQVLFPPELPTVPPIDDSPREPVVVKKPKCKGKSCKKRKPPPTQPKVSLRARISGISTSSKGTRIKISRGSNDGIQEGWRGSVITKSGSSIDGGSFTISKVTPSECYASVRASRDAVTSAKFVRLRPP